MKAIGYNEAGTADNLAVVEVKRPVIGPRDLLVAVKGISVNPVDVKLRAAVQPEGGVDPDPTGQSADRSHSDRDSFSAGDARLGAQNGR